MVDKNEERQWIQSAQKGDLGAFEQLIIQHEKKIYNVTYRMFRNEEDAKDLAQEVFIKAFQSINKFNQSSSFSTWIYRIAMNTCIDELRKRKGKQTYSIDEEYETEQGTMAKQYIDHLPGPEEEFIQKEEGQEIQQAIDQLPEEYKTTVILRDLQGLQYEEISKILDCSLGTVKSRIARGRKYLKEIIVKKQELFSVSQRLSNRKEGGK